MSSDLVSEGLSSRTMTFFGLGGSGVRAAEPLLHLCALGLGPRQLNIVLIDPDQSNAAVTRTRELLDLYRRTRAALTDKSGPADGYFRTEVKDVIGQTALWSPIADDDTVAGDFATRVGKALLTGRASQLGTLFDLLYSRELQRMDLTLGFRGVPSIGTVFMNRLREEPFFEQILLDARTDANSVFFATGSIFGGTGAAGLPVLGRALVDGVAREEGRNPVQGVDARRVGAALLLPYFTLPAPDAHNAADGGIRPEAALFAQNASAALPTYTAGQAGFSAMYVLGDDQPIEQKHNAVGGSGQDNQPHYVELFAALAALDFAARGGESQPGPVFRAIGANGANIRWDDLPLDAGSKKRLLGGVVAMHTFLTAFRPNGRSQPELDHALQGITWASILGVSSEDLQSHSEAFDLLGEFFRKTWNWLGELRASTPALELVRSNGREPTAVPLHETVDGRRASSQLPPTSSTGNEVFRYWNTVAPRYRGKGYGGLLDLMRSGSEMFAAERFSETINT